MALMIVTLDCGAGLEKRFYEFASVTGEFNDQLGDYGVVESVRNQHGINRLCVLKWQGMKLCYAKLCLPKLASCYSCMFIR